MSRGTVLLSSGPYLLSPLPERRPRSAGWHCGAIIQDLGQKLGLIPRRRPEVPGRKEANFENGWLWEDALEAEFKRRQRQRSTFEGQKGLVASPQRELCVDGIYLTPDLLWTKGGRPSMLDEYKWSCGQPPKTPADLLKDHWPWRVATHCYARAVGVTLVRFIVCWVGRWPEPIEYRFRYAEADMEADWAMVVKHRDRLEAAK